MDNDLRSLYTTELDAKAYFIESVIEQAAIFSLFFLYVLDFIPLAVLVVLLSIIYPRYVIMLHELFHISPAEQFGFCYRSLLVPVSPFNVGYREYVQIHHAHHKGPASEHDLDAFQIRGNRFKSLLGAIFSPEIHFFKWIKNNRIETMFVWESAARIMVFVALAIIAGIKFLWFWISLKLVYGVASFVFFNLVHYRYGQYGTFAIKLPAPLVAVAELLWGKTLVRAVMYHNLHHDDVRICAKHLKRSKTLSMP